jgi:hypothetical protein
MSGRLACCCQFGHDCFGGSVDTVRHNGPSIRIACGFEGLVSGDPEFQPCGFEDGTERSNGWVTTG